MVCERFWSAGVASRSPIALFPTDSTKRLRRFSPPELLDQWKKHYAASGNGSSSDRTQQAIDDVQERRGNRLSKNITLCQFPEYPFE
jgi:hypothetical protein